MGRSTKEKVTITDIKLSQIKDILNSDSSNLPDNDLKFSEVFQDSSTNDIYNDFIDPTYATAPAEGETYKDELTSKGFKIYDYRNYGGSEISSATPQIYWKTIEDNDNNSHIPTGESLSFMLGEQLFPSIVMFPDEDKIDNNIDTFVVSNKNLTNDYQSALFSENKLTDTNLATEVGIDYSGSYTGNVPEFSIKVTPYIADLSDTITYYKEVYNFESEEFEIQEHTLLITLSKVITLNSLVGGVISTFNLVIADPGNAATIIWDSFLGPLTQKIWRFARPGLQENIKVYQQLLELIPNTALESLSNFWGYLLPFLQGIAAFAGTIAVADMVWDWTHNTANINEAPFQFNNTVYGIYNFGDIRDSSYKFKFSNKHILDDPDLETTVSNGGVKHTYNLNDFNFGESFSSTNLIDNFPNNHPNKNKYLNIDFLPECYQYDLDTPLPVIEYFVELIPENNCILHPDKITAFSVRVMPQEHKYPSFELDGLIEDNLYLNSGVTFKNSKYCDFIYLTDQEESDGLFGVFSNRNINTPSFDTAGDTKILPYTGKDLNAVGYEIFSEQGSFVVTDESIYNANFMFEGVSNVLNNPLFRAEKGLSSELSPLRKYWEFRDSNSKIENGAFYKYIDDGVSGYLKQGTNLQDTNIFSPKYYKLTLELKKDSGNFYLLTDSTVFKHELIEFDATGFDEGEYDNVELTNEIGSNAIKFTSTGKYFILLETLNTINTNEIHFVTSSDFIGYVTECKLQYIPNKKLSSNKRGAFSVKSIPFKWKGGPLTSKLLELNFYSGTGSEGPYQFEFTTLYNSVSKITITWKMNQGEDIIDEYAATVDGSSNYNILNSVINKTFSTGYYPNKAEVLFELVYDPAEPEFNQLSSFICNDSKLLGFDDFNGVLYGSDVDLSGSGVGATYYTPNLVTFNSFPFVNSLNITNTNMQDSTQNVVSIGNSLLADNTPITGDLANIISIPTISLINTNISSYTIGQPAYDVGTEPNITWKNSDIDINSLNKLILDLDNSATENGTLDIGGDNPPIVDLIVLEAINNLVDSKGWNITYNTYIALADGDGDILIDGDGNYIGEGDITEVTAEPAAVFPEVTIGTQTWMSVNLDTDDGNGGIVAYNNDESNVSTYGRLYTWEAADRVAAATNGWHLPTRAEWDTLISYAGGTSVAGGKLKETGTTHWDSPNTGATDDYGFSARPAGYAFPVPPTNFDSLGTRSYFWTADREYVDTVDEAAYTKYMRNNDDNVSEGLDSTISSSFGSLNSIRLVKD